MKNNEELLLAPQYIFYMILQLVDPNEVNLRVMMKFILTVRNFYHSHNPYHKFEHAFHVCHSMYYILKRNLEKFSKVEVRYIKKILQVWVRILNSSALNQTLKCGQNGKRSPHRPAQKLFGSRQL